MGAEVFIVDLMRDAPLSDADVFCQYIAQSLFIKQYQNRLYRPNKYSYVSDYEIEN